MNQKENLEILITQKNQLLEELDKIKLNYNYDDGFDNKNDLETYVSENIVKITQLQKITKQIDKLEWELKSPEEQAQILEQRRLSRLKREGKLFDEMDN